MGTKTSNAAKGHKNQNRRRYTLPKKDAIQVKIAALPPEGKNFLHIGEARNEKAIIVRPYTQNKPIATVTAQARCVEAIINKPPPVNPPNGEREPQKGCCLAILIWLFLHVPIKLRFQSV
jgi:hypothetical protein